MRINMTADWPPIPPIQTGIRGHCPRCGHGQLFEGFLSLRPKCEICDLDYSFADPADGPAFFVICFNVISYGSTTRLGSKTPYFAERMYHLSNPKA